MLVFDFILLSVFWRKKRCSLTERSYIRDRDYTCKIVFGWVRVKWGGATAFIYNERGIARVYSGGLWAMPPVGSREKAPPQKAIYKVMANY